jgi:hypothetical protein
MDGDEIFSNEAIFKPQTNWARAKTRARKEGRCARGFLSKSCGKNVWPGILPNNLQFSVDSSRVKMQLNKMT